MQWIKSGIENPSKSEVIGRCGGDKKPNDHAEPTKVDAKKNKKIKKLLCCGLPFEGIKQTFTFLNDHSGKFCLLSNAAL